MGSLSSFSVLYVHVHRILLLVRCAVLSIAPNPTISAPIIHYYVCSKKGIIIIYDRNQLSSHVTTKLCTINTGLNTKSWAIKLSEATWKFLQIFFGDEFAKISPTHGPEAHNYKRACILSYQMLAFAWHSYRIQQRWLPR